MPESTPPEKSAIPQTTRRWIDTYSVVLILVAVAASVAAAASLRLAMDGGFCGIFYLWCMGPVLLIPAAFAVRALIVRNPRCRLRGLWSILVLLPILPICFLSLADSISSWRSNPVLDLSPLPSQGKFARTRIDVQLEGGKSVVHDPHNKVRFCFGGGPEETRIEGDQRILVFRHGVILKTWVDDIEFGSEGISLGGWMGAGREHGEMLVTQEGEFQEP